MIYGTKYCEGNRSGGSALSPPHVALLFLIPMGELMGTDLRALESLLVLTLMV
jgi:hypothetical protein